MALVLLPTNPLTLSLFLFVLFIDYTPCIIFVKKVVFTPVYYRFFLMFEGLTLRIKNMFVTV